jgi:hypothetical protein
MADGQVVPVTTEPLGGICPADIVSAHPAGLAHPAQGSAKSNMVRISTRANRAHVHHFDSGIFIAAGISVAE